MKLSYLPSREPFRHGRRASRMAASLVAPALAVSSSALKARTTVRRGRSPRARRYSSASELPHELSLMSSAPCPDEGPQPRSPAKAVQPVLLRAGDSLNNVLVSEEQHTGSEGSVPRQVMRRFPPTSSKVDAAMMWAGKRRITRARSGWHVLGLLAMVYGLAGNRARRLQALGPV